MLDDLFLGSRRGKGREELYRLVLSFEKLRFWGRWVDRVGNIREVVREVGEDMEFEGGGSFYLG